MSQNIFHIDPIFFLPIDLEENIKNKSKDIDNRTSSNERVKKNIKDINKNDIEEEITNEYSSSGKELAQYINVNKNNNIKEKKDEEKECIVYSTSINDPRIKYMTNSSKIYISEIFKSNWKLKSRRLITKLKKKLIKQYNKLYIKDDKIESDNKNVNFKSDISDNKNIMNLNNINNNIFICNNQFINNNNNIYKYINLPNVCTNINIYNQYNNNYQLINDSLKNNRIDSTH